MGDGVGFAILSGIIGTAIVCIGFGIFIGWLIWG